MVFPLLKSLSLKHLNMWKKTLSCRRWNGHTVQLEMTLSFNKKWRFWYLLPCHIKIEWKRLKTSITSLHSDVFIITRLFRSIWFENVLKRQKTSVHIDKKRTSGLHVNVQYMFKCRIICMKITSKMALKQSKWLKIIILGWPWPLTLNSRSRSFIAEHFTKDSMPLSLIVIEI